MNRGKDLASESTSSSFSWYRGGFSGVPNLENIFRKKTWKGTHTPPITACLMEAIWNVPPPLLLPTPHRGLDWDTCGHFDHLLYFFFIWFFYTLFSSRFSLLQLLSISLPTQLCVLSFRKQNKKTQNRGKNSQKENQNKQKTHKTQ